MDIIKTPKEIKLEPSEKGEVRELRIQVTDNGIFTYFNYYPLPLKGYPEKEVVDAVNIVKRLIILILKIINKTKILYLFLLIPTFRFFLLDVISDFGDKVLNQHYLKPQYFCISGKEIYKLGKRYIDKEKDDKKKIIYTRLTMLACMIWEYDTAYRFRGQFLLGKSLIPKDIIKEWLERETEQVSNKIKLIKPFLNFIPNNVLLGISQENIKLDEVDRYFAEYKNGFKWI